MEKISREITENLIATIQANKVIIIIGARRVGKTQLLRFIRSSNEGEYLYLNGEDITVHEALSKRSVANYRQLIGSFNLLLIDEAQHIPEIGSVLKLMIDEIEDLKIVITGSSAFDLQKLSGEPLTGRKYTFHLHTFSEREYNQLEEPLSKIDHMQERLVYGNYPELIHIPNKAEKQRYLNELISAYLLKDILVYEQIKNSQKLFNLLRLLAFQIGKQVSMQELGSQLSISKNTVEKYMDLLSKVFILHRIDGFSKNLRKEVSKNSRWYFYDNGIRNAVIANYNSLESRNDIGQLWENYLISERIKYLHNKGIQSNNYFWRTYDQQEIDWVEERGGKLHAFEIKWTNKKNKIPSKWPKAYPDASYEVINRDNYLNWLEAN